ncbi:MAG: hypothetical protein AB2792_13410 [Candidatus Thiodiazotropha sp.]
MSKELFHKTEKGLSNEDWYYYVVDDDTSEVSILHEWSHSSGGPFNFKSDERTYNLEEFENEKPNEYRKLTEWLNNKNA